MAAQKKEKKSITECQEVENKPKRNENDLGSQNIHIEPRELKTLVQFKPTCQAKRSETKRNEH